MSTPKKRGRPPKRPASTVAASDVWIRVFDYEYRVNRQVRTLDAHNPALCARDAAASADAAVAAVVGKRARS